MPELQAPVFEHELTYLAANIPPEINEVEPVRLLDVYIPDTLNHAKLRLRKKGDNYEITKKTLVDVNDASSQIEQTIVLTQEEFEALAVVSSKRVEKDRYVVQLAGRTAEIDVFLGDLKGLVLIDFEFDTTEEKDAFIAPDVCLADVTQEDFIAGGELAGKSYADITAELSRFAYEKLLAE